MSNAIVRNKLTKRITSLSFDKKELKRLLDILQLRANSASEIEYKKFENQNSENLENIKKDLDFCAELKVTVTGHESEELFGSINEVFSSVSFPERIKSIYLNSKLTYQALYKYSPDNSFEVIIDFSKPRVFDFSFQPSEQTPNDSSFEVQGSDNTWVNGVFHEIDAYISTKPSKFPRVHRGSFYDVLVWLFGIPFGFWVCYKIISFNLSLLKNHSFYEALLLTYSFLASLFLFRIIFHYSRWVYSMIEYRGKKDSSIKHQAVLFSIIIGIIGSILYDIILYFLK